MPARNSIKTYFAPGFYHLYNRGADGREIFGEKQDYVVFLRFLKDCLAKPVSPAPEEDPFMPRHLPKNLAKEIDLLAFVLMPNHFHLLLKQTTTRAMETMMRSITTRYSMYFNKKYQRSGTLFQGIYRAVIVDSNEQLLHLSRYIHCNPPSNLRREYEWSSYPNYLAQRKFEWLKPEGVLAGRSPKKYQDFVEGTDTPSIPQMIDKLAID